MKVEKNSAEEIAALVSKIDAKESLGKEEEIFFINMVAAKKISEDFLKRYFEEGFFLYSKEVNLLICKVAIKEISESVLELYLKMDSGAL